VARRALRIALGMEGASENRDGRSGQKPVVVNLDLPEVEPNPEEVHNARRRRIGWTAES